jgi:hypothetical protein
MSLHSIVFSSWYIEKHLQAAYHEWSARQLYSSGRLGSVSASGELHAEPCFKSYVIFAM